jgi:hypothetical protein
MPAQKRYLKSRYVLQALRKRSGRLLVASVILALVFAGLARIQHRFVHSQVYRMTSQELASKAEEIAGEVAYEDKWDLKDYRDSSGLPGEPSDWYILTRDGLIVDITGFIPGVFGRVRLSVAPDVSLPMRNSCLRDSRRQSTGVAKNVENPPKRVNSRPLYH